MTQERICEGLVNGTLHRSSSSAGRAIVLAHGAGSNSESKLLVALAEAFADMASTHFGSTFRTGWIALQDRLTRQEPRATGKDCASRPSF